MWLSASICHLLEEITTHCSLPTIALQAPDALVRGFLTWVKVLAVGLAVAINQLESNASAHEERIGRQAYLSNFVAVGPDQSGLSFSPSLSLFAIVNRNDRL